MPSADYKRCAHKCRIEDIRNASISPCSGGNVKVRRGFMIANFGLAMSLEYPSFRRPSSLVITLASLISLPAAGIVSTDATGSIRGHHSEQHPIYHFWLRVERHCEPRFAHRRARRQDIHALSLKIFQVVQLQMLCLACGYQAQLQSEGKQIFFHVLSSFSPLDSAHPIFHEGSPSAA